MGRVLAVCRALEQEYGRPRWQRNGSVLDELISTILSQNTTAKQAQKAYQAIKERFGDWEAVMQCDLGELSEAIHVGGLAKQKACSIKAVLNDIYAGQGNLNLEWLGDVSDAEALNYLRSFHGVGLKTAACVLMFGLGRPVMPVDTHVYRITTRLGLIRPQGINKAHEDLQRLVPPEMVYSCHINLVRHGRQICRARNPRCPDCVLRDYCDTHIYWLTAGGTMNKEIKGQGEDLVVVYRAADEFVADIVIGLLKSAGIPAVLESRQVPQMDGVMRMGEGYWGDVVVPRPNAAHAREILKAYEQTSQEAADSESSQQEDT